MVDVKKLFALFKSPKYDVDQVKSYIQEGEEYFADKQVSQLISTVDASKLSGEFNESKLADLFEQATKPSLTLSDAELEQVKTFFEERSENSGSVNWEDVKEILAKAGVILGNDQVSRITTGVQTEMGRYDFENFVRIYRRGRLMEVYKLFDKDDSDYISIGDLGACLEKAGVSVTESQAARLAKAVGADQVGRVGFEMLAKLYHLAQKEVAGYSRCVVKAACDMFADGDGTIPFGEIKTCLESLEVNLSVGQIARLSKLVGMGGLARGTSLEGEGFVRLYEVALRKDVWSLETSFRELDGENAGYISADKLKARLAKSGFKLNNNKIAKLFKIADPAESDLNKLYFYAFVRLYDIAKKRKN